MATYTKGRQGFQPLKVREAHSGLEDVTQRGLRLPFETFR
jgi:hypothetical protein